MMNEKEIKELLRSSLEKYIKALERESFDYSQYKGEVIACMKILKFKENEYKYLDIDIAKKLLDEI